MLHVARALAASALTVLCACANAEIRMDGYFVDSGSPTWIYACVDSLGNENRTHIEVDSATKEFQQSDSRCAGDTRYQVSKSATSYTISAADSQGVNGSGKYSFSPAMPYLPVVTELGHTYNASGTVAMTEGTTSLTGTYTTKVTVEANEPVATFGGIFSDAIRVSRTVTMVFRLPDRDVTHTRTEQRWFAKGIGEVRHEQDSELADGTPYHLSMSLYCTSLLGPCSKDDGDKDCDDDCIMAGDPINVATGNSYQEQVDYELPSWPGAVRRLYNSRVPTPTTLGWNWRHGYDRRIEFIGSGKPRRALLHRADGKLLVFKEDTSVLVGGQPTWKPEQPDERGRLSVTGTTVVDGRSVPAAWRYSASNDEIEQYDGKGKLTRLTDLSGQWLSLEYEDRAAPSGPARTITVLARIRNSFGRVLHFRYDTSLRLASVADGSTTIVTYGYDSQSRLIRATYADFTSRRYAYNEAGRVPSGSSFPHALTGLTAEDDRLFASWHFDTSGRATVSQLGSGKNRVGVSYGSGSSSVIDPLNMTRTVGLTRVAGTAKVTSYSAMGTATLRGKDAMRGHDPNGNLVRRVDFNGNLTCSSFDMTRNVETVRVEGLASTVACNTVTAPGSVLPIDSRKSSFAWHPERRLIVQKAEPMRQTYFIFNGQPDPTAGNAIATCAPASATLPDGKPIAVLCRKVVRATTDATGSQGLAPTVDTTVPSRIWSYTYNAAGQVLTAKSPRTDVIETTTYAYYEDTTAEHTLGDLKSVTNAKNQLTQYPLYTKAGQVQRMIDANNVVTDYTYDLRQRLKTITTAGRPVLSIDYHTTGQLKRATQADGSFVDYGYDDAQRLTSVSDHLGNRIEYTLDNAGNKTEERVKDPASALSRQMRRIMDALGRVQQSTGRN